LSLVGVAVGATTMVAVEVLEVFVLEQDYL
jgi:hypothetical protein